MPFKSTPGKAYCPSNGTEGMMFMETYCFRCQRDAAFQADQGEGCPIISRTMLYSIGDPEYPVEWTHGPDGMPTCTVFEVEK